MTCGSRAFLSTASSYTLEEVAAAAARPPWFQLYPFGDRALVEGLLARAAAVGCEVLCVTVDVPVMGNREGERRVGTTQPRLLTPRRLWNLARHPR